MKIVLIGAGSHSFGSGQIADLMQDKKLKGRDVTLSLVDLNEQALQVMMQLAQRMKEYTGSDVRLEATTDRLQALPGADYIITAVARKRMELWEQDFRVPLAYGFRHCFGENGGPGAVFHALRSFELVIPICRDIERLCPDALLLNFTNPEARVLHAILHLTKVKAAGICHGAFYALDLISEYLKRPHEEFRVITAGMNHFYCMLKAEEIATGKDWLPELVRMAAAETSRDDLRIFRKMAEIFGIFTMPADGHIGEYLSYGSEFSGVKYPFGAERRAVKLTEQAKDTYYEDYASGKRPIDSEILEPSGEMTVPIITDVELNTGAFRPAVNVLNSEGFIANLPADAAIEVPATVDAKGIHPLMVGPLPEPFAAMVRTQCTIISLLTEAYRTRSKKLLLQALLLDPNVNSISGATHLLDDMLKLQSEYLGDGYE